MSGETLSREYLPKLRRNLEETVGFWYPKCVDDDHGGYVLGYDRSGAFDGNDDKMIVTQARMVWFFSRLARSGYGDEYLEAATAGYEFLTGEMWDDEHGGFYWEVDRSGAVTKPNKHMYGQSFGIYGLVEYYRASGREAARDLALDLFDLFESESYDAERGGYVEYFQPDWTPIETGRTYLETIEPDWSEKESDDASLDPSMKLMNTHLHLMEALTELARASDDPRVEARLAELLAILTNTVVRKRLTACTDKYTATWEPRLDREEFRIVSYGHDVENVWLVMEACDALGIPAGLFRDLFERLYDYSLEYGYDEDRGGFYFFGPFEAAATNTVKAWWVQAEGLTSALKLYALTGDERYRRVFEETYDFVHEHQVDWEVGEWHSGITDDLEAVGRKGAMYKGAYHNGRAMLECIEELERLSE